MAAGSKTSVLIGSGGPSVTPGGRKTNGVLELDDAEGPALVEGSNAGSVAGSKIQDLLPLCGFNAALVSTEASPHVPMFV